MQDLKKESALKADARWNSYELSGSEFALRVAVCDLVQRLKRSEQTCKYLETCRNELAKECIKLRHENHYMSKHLSALSQNSEVRGSKNVLFNIPTEDVSKNGIEGKNRNDSVNDESWQEISERLLKELKQEMLGAILSNQDNRNEVNETIPSESVNQILNRTANEYETQVRHMAINDSCNNPLEYSESKESDQSNESCSVSQASKACARSTSVIRVEGSNKGYHYSVGDLVQILEAKEQRNDDKDEMNNLINVELNSKDKTDVDMCVEVLRSVNNNVEEIAKVISQQNEKLTRLKSKQLRNYFKRQLEYTGSPNYKSDPHSKLEHV